MKFGGAALILISLAIGGLWLSHGGDLGTREQVPVTVKSIDDFGDETETVKWEAPTGYPVTGFHVGLDYAGPVGGLFFAAGFGLVILNRRRERNSSL